MKLWSRVPLYVKIFILLVLGGIIGFVFGPKVAFFKSIGDAYILLLKMLVVPLVMVSIISGVGRLDSVKEFGQVGTRIITMYIVTSTLAAAFGVLLAVVYRPGVDASGMLGVIKELKYSEYSVAQTVLSWIPENIFRSMANMDMIPVILFSILFGVCMLKLGNQKKALLDCLEVANSVMLTMTNFVAELAPYGIFFLSMQLTGTIGSKMLVVGAKFVLAQYTGLICLLIIGYPALIVTLGHFSPITFYRNIFPAMLFAASTTSSNATLPISFKCSGENCGVPEKIYGFTLPLGATINMDGFSVALGVIAITALELYDVPVTTLTVIKAVGMGLILSIGAPGVKGTAVVMSAVLFQALGLPMGMLPLIAAIWPVVDVGNTTVNVTGDHVCTCIVSSRLNLMNREVFDRFDRSKKDI